MPPDIAVAVMLMAITLAVTRWFRKSNFTSAGMLGMALGVGLLVKTTLIIAIPLLLSLGIVAVMRGRHQWRHLFAGIAVVGVVSLLVVNFGYGWQGTFTPLKDYRFVSPSLTGGTHTHVSHGNRFSDHWIGNLPVFMPREFVSGVDVQYYDFETQYFYPYLLGQWRREGFPLFYIWYYLLKMPIGLLALASISVVSLMTRQIQVRDPQLLGSLAILAVGAFAFVSWRTDLNFCQRYSLVSLPLLCAFAGAAWFVFRTFRSKCLIALLVTSNVAIGWVNAPHSLSYYNVLAHGPSCGKYLLQGNGTDWGQDAIHVGQWCQSHPDRRPLSIAMMGYPTKLLAYQVKADHLRFDQHLRMPLDAPVPFGVPDLASKGYPVQAEGWHIISIFHLLNPRSPYHVLLHRKPDEMIGHTHHVYYLNAIQAKAFVEGRFQPLENELEPL